MTKHNLKLAAVLFAGVLCAGAQTSAPSTMAKDDLFAGTEKFSKGAVDVTELNMDPQSLNMVGGKNAARAHRTVLNVVRTYRYDKTGMYAIGDVEEIRNRLNTGDWHCSVHTSNTARGESTDICNKARTDGMTETAIITVEPKELTFIHTIRQGGDGGGMSSVDTGAMNPAAMNFDFNPQMALLQAQMRVTQAEMQARIAEMQPRIDAALASIPALVPDAAVTGDAPKQMMLLTPDAAPKTFLLKVPAAH